MKLFPLTVCKKKKKHNSFSAGNLLQNIKKIVTFNLLLYNNRTDFNEYLGLDVSHSFTPFTSFPSVFLETLCQFINDKIRNKKWLQRTCWLKSWIIYSAVTRRWGVTPFFAHFTTVRCSKTSHFEEVTPERGAICCVGSVSIMTTINRDISDFFFPQQPLTARILAFTSCVCVFVSGLYLCRFSNRSFSLVRFSYAPMLVEQWATCSTFRISLRKKKNSHYRRVSRWEKRRRRRVVWRGNKSALKKNFWLIRWTF